MTLLDSIAIIVTALASVSAAGFAWQARKKVETVHLLINSRMDAWLKAAEALAEARGVAKGQAMEVMHREQEANDA